MLSIFRSNEALEEEKKLKVTMVAWDCSDTWVVTAVSDHMIKIWEAGTGKLKHILTGHTDEIYVLESHPHEAHMVLSAGHDGHLFVWDVFRGVLVAHFMNNIEGQGYGALFDAKWSPDGTTMAATDSHGHLLMFGLGSGNAMLKQVSVNKCFIKILSNLYAKLVEFKTNIEKLKYLQKYDLKNM